MILRKKNEGTYIPFASSGDGTRIGFADGALEIDLAAEQRGYPRHIDISEDEDGKLVTGPAFRYIAELDIPAVAYEIYKKGYADDVGIEQVGRKTLPLDTDRVVLTLWAKGV
jgi:hypothetical protein